jgi:putative ABC transport system permease protein
MSLLQDLRFAVRLMVVVRRSLVLLAVGLCFGMAGAFAVGRLLRSLLVQTSPNDPATLSAIALLVVAVSLAACVWQARRHASRPGPRTPIRMSLAAPPG